jgi:hypothetical protein
VVEHLLYVRPEFKPQYHKKIKNKAKMAGGVAQGVECLPSKCKALSSNTNTTKENKE